MQLPARPEPLGPRMPWLGRATRSLPAKAEARGSRAARFDRASVNVEGRTCELAFSSEEPVERWWGMEILGHDRGEVDEGWISGGTAPLLCDHSPRDVVGVVETATLGSDRKMRATVRFGRSQRASEVFQDVQDGIRVNVSVGYEILEAALVSEKKGEPPVYRVTKWRPLEVSLVSIPADTTVGVGRDAPIPPAAARTVPPSPSATGARSLMEDDEDNKPANAPPTREQIAEASKRYIKEMMELGQLANARDKANDAIARGITIEAFRGELVTARASDKPLGTPPSEIGLSAKEVQSFSLSRMIMAQADKNDSLAPMEIAAARAAGEAMQKSGHQVRNGMMIPWEIVNAPVPTLRMQEGRIVIGAGKGQRDLTSETSGTFDPATSGGYLTGTTLLASSFIELLRAAMMVRQMGATILSGLIGNVAIPRQSSSATAGWVQQAGAASESNAAYVNVTLLPKTVHAIQDFTRELLLQATPDIEGLVRLDLAAVVGLAIDAAALHGTGASGQPTGLAATSGIGSVAGGTNGLAPTWDHIVDLETGVANANAAVARLGYLTNSKVRGKLKRTPIISGQPVFLWGGMPGMAAQNAGTVPVPMSTMNEYPAAVSNNVRSNLTKGTSSGVCSAIFFGNWRDLLIGEWGGLETLVDNVTQAANRIIRVHAYQSVDVGVRNAGSFSAMLDALTV